MSKIVASVISGRWEWEERLVGQRGAGDALYFIISLGFSLNYMHLYYFRKDKN